MKRLLLALGVFVSVASVSLAATPTPSPVPTAPPTRTPTPVPTPSVTPTPAGLEAPLTMEDLEDLDISTTHWTSNTGWSWTIQRAAFTQVTTPNFGYIYDAGDSFVDGTDAFGNVPVAVRILVVPEHGYVTINYRDYLTATFDGGTAVAIYPPALSGNTVDETYYIGVSGVTYTDRWLTQTAVGPVPTLTPKTPTPVPNTPTPTPATVPDIDRKADVEAFAYMTDGGPARFYDTTYSRFIYVPATRQLYITDMTWAMQSLGETAVYWSDSTTLPFDRVYGTYLEFQKAWITPKTGSLGAYPIIDGKGKGYIWINGYIE